MNTDPLGKLLDWVAATRYEDLPASTVAASKTYFLNTAAAMLGGSGAPGAVEVVKQVREWGGRPQSTVVVHGLKVPAPLAALANGVMAHAMDFDDTQVGTGLHPNVSLVPALLAVVETVPKASGRDLILAHVLGLEIVCRMTLAASNRGSHPWLTTTLFGVFGAAVAAGKILELDTARLRHAVGIVYSSAGGNRQGLLDGTLIQRVQPGLCAQAAVAAVAFASQGVTGAHDVLEGRYGLYPSYYGRDYEAETLTSDLGRDFRMLDIALKPYPCCSYIQESLDAVLELVREHRFEPDDVAEAIVSVASEHAAGLVNRPYEPRSCAQVDAQFSMQYAIGTAICRRAFSLADLLEPALRAPAALALAPRVSVVVEAERDGNVELRMRDGRVLSNRVRVARGHPRRPMERRELQDKLQDCGRHAAVPRKQTQLASLEQGITQLEHRARGADLAVLLA